MKCPRKHDSCYFRGEDGECKYDEMTHPQPKPDAMDLLRMEEEAKGE